MNTNRFYSHLACQREDFVTFKQLQGYTYTGPAKHLRAFDRFLAEQPFDQPYLTLELDDAYFAHTKALSPNTRRIRLSIAREFSRHLHQREPESHVLRKRPGNGSALPRFYLYEEAEIAALMQAARRLSPATALRPHTHSVLLGLLAVTGLRIDEALTLDLYDLACDDKLLSVRHGKFGKDRLLPLADSTVHALRAYLKHRLDFGLRAPTDPLFLSGRGRRLSYSTALKTFNTLLQQEGIGVHRPQAPRLHDLRHTCATRTLLKWYQEGRDVNAMLPVLATDLGHVSIASTQLYLHVCSQLLAEANTRFQNAFQPAIPL